MCVCVFWRSICSKFLNWETILRDYCVDWIIGWVVCWIAFMSVFFSSRKTVLKSWLDTSWYLAICRASQAFFLLQSRQLLDTWWIDRENSYLLDTWWIDRAFVLGSDELFLDTFSIPQLSTTFFLIPTLIASSTPLDTCIYRDLLKVYIYLLRDPFLISSTSLDFSAPVHLPNILSFTPNLFLWDFSSLFQDFSSIGKFLISHSLCISWFET